MPIDRDYSREFGIISDVHCGPDAGTRAGTKSLTLLERAVSALSDDKVSFVVDLGDRINDVNNDTDRDNVEAVSRLYRGLSCPVFAAYGNHDTVNLSKRDQNSILGKSGSYESFDIDDRVRIIILDSVDPAVDRVGGSLSSRQLEWLRRTVDCDRRLFVFVHHPIDEQDLAVHWYFGSNSHHAGISNRAEIVTILSESNCLGVFSGHLHWIKHNQVRGIPAVTVPSLVDTTFTGGFAPGLFTTVAIRDNTLTVNHRTATGTFLRYHFAATDEQPSNGSKHS